MTPRAPLIALKMLKTPVESDDAGNGRTPDRGRPGIMLNASHFRIAGAREELANIGSTMRSNRDCRAIRSSAKASLDGIIMLKRLAPAAAAGLFRIRRERD